MGVREGRPLLDDGRTLDVANVIWCTGFRAGFPWIDLPIFDEKGEPRHESGIVTGCPASTSSGLHFLYALSSSMIHGVGATPTASARPSLPARFQSARPATLDPEGKEAAQPAA